MSVVISFRIGIFMSRDEGMFIVEFEKNKKVLCCCYGWTERGYG